MEWAKHISGKNIFWSTLIAKSMIGKNFEILHCPLEPPAKLRQQNDQSGYVSCQHKSQKRNTGLPPLHLVIKVSTYVDQNVFFTGTCFAYAIS